MSDYSLVLAFLFVLWCMFYFVTAIFGSFCFAIACVPLHWLCFFVYYRCVDCKNNILIVPIVCQHRQEQFYWPLILFSVCAPLKWHANHWQK
jgi:hypothetical protein